MDLLFKIVIFLIMFSVIIIVHEGGHFILAKKNGIAVKEFSMGLGPRILGREIDGTMFSLCALPFGGACIFEGINGEESIGPGNFNNCSIYGRIATVIAGPVCNFLLAFFVALFMVGAVGIDVPEIADVIEDYPAQEAGLQAGDVIKQLGDTKIVVYRDISAYTLFFEGKSTKVVYEREGKEYTTYITPKYDEELGRYLFGIAGSVGRQKVGPLEVIRYSLHEVWFWIDECYKSLAMVFQGRITKDDVAGPVGMAQMVGSVYDDSKDDGFFYIWVNMLNLTLLISANLGVMNLLPIPALDGGRLVFLLIELISGKKVDPDKEAMVHFAGIMVLLAFMVFVMVNDISKFFR